MALEERRAFHPAANYPHKPNPSGHDVTAANQVELFRHYSQLYQWQLYLFRDHGYYRYRRQRDCGCYPSKSPFESGYLRPLSSVAYVLKGLVAGPAPDLEFHN
jgi:hypothetical protein